MLKIGLSWTHVDCFPIWIDYELANKPTNHWYIIFLNIFFLLFKTKLIFDALSLA